MTKRIDCFWEYLRLPVFGCSVFFVVGITSPHSSKRCTCFGTCVSVCSVCVFLWTATGWSSAQPGRVGGMCQNLKAFSTLSLVLIDGLGTRHSPNMAPSVQDCSRVYGWFFFCFRLLSLIRLVTKLVKFSVLFVFVCLSFNFKD